MDGTGLPPTGARVEEPDGAPRIAGLDVLRGIAILGILFMNINTMGGSVWAMFAFDPRHLGWSPADRIAWATRDLLADGTARCMLELLFGAGMMILTDRFAAHAQSRWTVLKRYYWRNLVLFLFGIVHMLVLLWGGDILHTYALAAIVAALFRSLPPRWLLVAGLIGVAVPVGNSAVGYYDAISVRHQADTIRARVATGQAPTPAERRVLRESDRRVADRAQRERRNADRIAAEDRERQSGAAGWIGFVWRVEADLQADGFELPWVWEAASIMLVGAALYGWGILQGRRSRRFYAAWTVGFYALGLTIRAIGTRDALRFYDGLSLIWPLYEVGRLATTLGHLGLIHLLLGTGWGARLLQPFAAAGRTALSIYILQTLICLWVIYPPWGFALYARQGWMSLMLTAAAVDLALLLLANWWVRHYRIAPVEWAWRSIVEGRRLPFRNRGTAVSRGEPLPA